MIKSPLYIFFSFLAVILFTILILPHLPIIFRPNLLLIFCILFAFLAGLEKIIWYWIISGIVLDSFISSNFPVNSAIFIALFILILFFSKVFDYSTKMSQLLTASILISLYYFSFFIIDFVFLKKQNFTLFIYLIETLAIFVIFFKIKNKEKRNEKTFPKIH